MKAVRIGATVIAIAASIAMTGAVSASEGQAVTITVNTQIGGFVDPFGATGGVICAAGTVTTVASRFVGWQSGSHAQIVQTKRFACPDGTVDVLLRVSLDFATGDTAGTWSVVVGSGAYSSLRGSGSLTGDKADPDATTILDTYTGAMHLD